MNDLSPKQLIKYQRMFGLHEYYIWQENPLKWLLNSYQITLKIHKKEIKTDLGAHSIGWGTEMLYSFDQIYIYSDKC